MEWWQMTRLLSASLWDTQVKEAPFWGPVDWKRIFTLAFRQAVTGLVADGASRLPQPLQPSAKEMQKLQMILVKNEQRHQQLNRTLVEVTNLLAKEGIRAILLKGQGVAQNYPTPTLRACGDIDLYIGPENYVRACRLADQWNGTDENSSESKKHYHFCHQGVTIEFHRIAERLPMPWHNARFQRWTQENLQQNKLRKIYIGGAEILLPPVHFDTLYIFNHAWHHFVSSGIGLRQLCDWARYLHTFHSEIDCNILKTELKAFGLWRSWQLFGYIVVKYVGLPQEECPFYNTRYARQAEAIVLQIKQEGNFGFFRPVKSARPHPYMAGKWYSLKNSCRRYAELLPICPLETLQAWIYFFHAGIHQVIKEKM